MTKTIKKTRKRKTLNFDCLMNNAVTVTLDVCIFVYSNKYKINKQKTNLFSNNVNNIINLII